MAIEDNGPGDNVDASPVSRREAFERAGAVAAGAAAFLVAAPAMAQQPAAARPPAAQPPRPVGGTPGQTAPVYRAVPQLGRLRDDVLFGDVWNQPELSLRDRSLVTCAALAAMGREAELNGHIRRAIDNGCTIDELRGMAVQVAFYAGWPAGIAVGNALIPIINPPPRAPAAPR